MQGKAIWNLIKFSSLLLLCEHGWVASGESSIKTQVRGEAGTGNETSSQIFALVKMGLLSSA